MFYSMNHLKEYWGVTPTQILHVGAHKAEELDAYLYAGCKHIFWVEAQKDCVNELRSRLDPLVNTVIEAAVWSEDGVELKFNIANNSESSSLYEFGTHQASYPKISFSGNLMVQTRKLDSVIPKSATIDFVNLDIQGAELRALQGFTQSLRRVKWIYSEVNSKSVYEDCSLVDEIDEFLENFGFRRVCVRWWKKDGWGDALYIHSSVAVPRNLKIQLLRNSSQLFWHLKNLIRIILNR
jgi:FkbM family methyltransferase